MARDLTDKQRAAMAALQAARAAGMGLSAYARANGPERATAARCGRGTAKRAA